MYNNHNFFDHMNCLLPASFTTRSFIYDQAIYLFAEEYDMQTICPKSRTLLLYFICFFMSILNTHIHAHRHFNSTFITSSISIICLTVFYFILKNQMAVQVVTKSLKNKIIQIDNMYFFSVSC